MEDQVLDGTLPTAAYIGSVPIDSCVCRHLAGGVVVDHSYHASCCVVNAIGDTRPDTVP